jgi:hypothetical protein
MQVAFPTILSCRLLKPLRNASKVLERIMTFGSSGRGRYEKKEFAELIFALHGFGKHLVTYSSYYLNVGCGGLGGSTK